MTMPGYQTPTPPPTASAPGRHGLATASLVLGLAGLPGLLLCGLGLPAALVGLVLGIAAAARGTSRGLAIAGIVCSAVTLVIGAVSIIWLLSKAAECADRHRYPDVSTRRQCIDREFPFARSSGAP
ncbi:hypothetical protein DZF91_19515 [Actinomadura logoneensis]|uniref:DUF4190 domain-containing protein n=1 Tax=Actinomadura logoneensis TaxID=2293572 RepID=A0A372JKW6_9ACTN|nr:hypothetical protein [Actinomadura logoneensis]RFU39968.1 hypothetical protein DZF91_19515 [Actinomadura logoneensis]